MVKCNEKLVSRVLIDNGSLLNVCPLATLNLLGIDMAQVKPSATTVRAFDGFKRDIAGEVDLEVEIALPICLFYILLKAGLHISNLLLSYNQVFLVVSMMFYQVT